jgi:hypothetical protein
MFTVGLHVGDAGALAIGLFMPEADILAGAIQLISNLLQFGMIGALSIRILARALQLGFQPCSVGVQFGLTIGHGPQFIEHAGGVLRHADLIGFGVVSLGSCLLQLVAQVVPLLDQLCLIGLDPLHQRLQQVLDLGPLFTMLAVLAVGIPARPFELIADPLQLGGIVGADLLQFGLVVDPLLSLGGNMVHVLLGQQLGQGLDGPSIRCPNNPNIYPNMLDPTWGPTLVQQSIIPRQKHAPAIVAAYAQLGVFS